MARWVRIEDDGKPLDLYLRVNPDKDPELYDQLFNLPFRKGAPVVLETLRLAREAGLLDEAIANVTGKRRRGRRSQPVRRDASSQSSPLEVHNEPAVSDHVQKAAPDPEPETTRPAPVQPKPAGADKDDLAFAREFSKRFL